MTTREINPAGLYVNNDERLGDHVECTGQDILDQAAIFGDEATDWDVEELGKGETMPTSDINVPVCVVFARSVYAGTLGMDGHARVLTRYDVDGSNDHATDPATWATAQEARAYIARQESGVYLPRHGEAGRPDYWVVPATAADDVAAHHEDNGAYVWPEESCLWSCADAARNACGDCEQCREFMAAADDAILETARM